MFKNHLKIAWRNLLKNKVYSAINIGGLAIGITACLLILQYVSFELSYEDFHEKKDRIYRVKQNRYDNGELTTEWAAGAFAVGGVFKKAIPEIEDYVKLIAVSDVVVDTDTEPLKFENAFYASESFFKIFSYSLIAGNGETALVEPHTAAISKTMAQRVFGKTDVIGESLTFNGYAEYRITGVFDDMPANTQLQPNVLLSNATRIQRILEQDPDANPDEWWTSDGCLTYFLLKEHVDPKIVEAKFPQIFEESISEDFANSNSHAEYFLHALTDIHLYSDFMMEPAPTGDGKTVYMLLFIALFVIVIAWVNYINLATARAISRAKEVGVRKAVGSHKKQLVTQFLIESALCNLLAVGLALLLTAAFIPSFNNITGLEISYDLLINGTFWLGLTVLFIAGVVLSGSYPAFVLSKYKPVEVLKGKMMSTKQGSSLRKSLVVVQFAASLFLLIGTFTVYNQIDFMGSQPLGIDIEQTLVLPRPMVIDSLYESKMNSFKQSLTQYQSIKQVSSASTVPGQNVGWNAGGVKLTSQDDNQGQQYRIIGAEHAFISQFDIKLIAGSDFPKEYTAENNAVIFNESGINQLGFINPSEAIGKEIDFWGDQCVIVGVSENFHQKSLKESFEPLIIKLIPNVDGYYAIKMESDQVAETIEIVQTQWDSFFPGNTFEYFFLDDHFNKQYEADNRFKTVFGIFAVLAILVACLGLFGLASFTSSQRRKEIGVRKVLGASVGSIVQLLYKEFSVLILISFLVAIPLAWLGISSWLEGYAFKTSIHWSFFIIPFLIIACISLVTISFQAVKAAIANPTESLRSE